MLSDHSNDKLLVFGDDGSASSSVAWDWINAQAWPDWTVEVVTATDPDVRPPATGPRSDEPRVWRPATPRVPSPRSQLAPATHLLVDADPRIALAARTDASLLVVGRGDLGRRFARVLGSTAAWLVHHPPAPLLVAAEPRRVRRVLMCTDGSVDAEVAMERLIDLPLSHTADITVLSVYDGWAETDVGLRTARKLFTQAGIEVSTEELGGRAVPTILELAEDRDVDLVVLGRRGLSGWDWLRIGSTTAAVAHHASCSILIAGGPA